MLFFNWEEYKTLKSISFNPFWQRTTDNIPLSRSLCADLFQTRGELGRRLTLGSLADPTRFNQLNEFLIGLSTNQ
jgi:hypothetical protein